MPNGSIYQEKKTFYEHLDRGWNAYYTTTKKSVKSVAET